MTADELPERFVARRVYPNEPGFIDGMSEDCKAARLIRPDSRGDLSGYGPDFRWFPVVAAYDLRASRYDLYASDLFVVERIDGLYVIR